jgi:predicted lipoprotein with Yx(FWY)xxD motif
MYKLGLIAVTAVLAACGESASPTPSAGSSAKTVGSASVSVNNKTQTVLVDANNNPLYYNINDTLTTSSCTTASGCAVAWPPLLATQASLSEAASVTGVLKLVTNANGSQVQYNGHFLYTFAGDASAPGLATGDGSPSGWHVATPDLAAVASTSTPTARTGY